ncbi:MAG: ethanolamine ammonia-lyase reactivating factor EutA [Gemmataceae bacterium]
MRLGDAGAATVRALGRRLADLLEQIDFPNDTPLVLLIEENVGRVLGQYASRWGDSRRTLLSIDEVPFRSGQYVRIGSPRGQVVPVSIYGLTAEMLS